MNLIRSISGLRGVVGGGLTPDVIVKYSAGFAQYCNRGRIIIGRDGRVSGKIIGNIVSSTLLSMGCDVVALGIVPTPTVALAVEKLGATGGIAITASHNPIQWNGLKFIGEDGLFLNLEENEKLWTLVDRNDFRFAPWDKLGKHTPNEKFIDEHIDSILKLSYINPQQIRKKKFKIVVDCINAAGGKVIPRLLRDLGCDVIEMNCEVSGIFSRMPEPIPENLNELCSRVLKEKADFGIAVDPDVDRLVLITEKGEPFGEEYTITAVVKFILEKHNSQIKTIKSTSQIQNQNRYSVVVNLSTTRAVDDIAKVFGVKVIRTPVGEINVAKKMKEVGAIIGGEGSGGVILPAVHYGRDAIVGIVLILQQLSEFDGKLSDLKLSLPQYIIKKLKVEIDENEYDKIIKNIINKYGSAEEVNVDDGLKIDFQHSWIHLRRSNTEPILRIIAEAPSSIEADEIINKFKRKYFKEYDTE